MACAMTETIEGSSGEDPSGAEPLGAEPSSDGRWSEAEIEEGRRLFAADCRFVAGADSPERLPPFELPEIAFAGRSNVGKSSLVNALTGRKTLARASNTPGRTQQINFFELGGKLLLVDLPGYGYAAVSRKEKKSWQGLAELYLKGRPTLARVLLLIDARHGLKESDKRTMKQLDEAAQSFQVVLTKADKPKLAELKASIAATTAAAERYTACYPTIAVTSAVDGRGLPELRAALAALASQAALR